MKKETTTDQTPSRVGWGDLEKWVRQQVQRLVQDILEEEMTEFLGRATRLRHGRGDALPGLGPHGDVLPLPEGALAAPADQQPGGVTLRRATAAHRRGQTLQEGRTGHCHDLEVAPGG